MDSRTCSVAIPYYNNCTLCWILFKNTINDDR